MSNFRRVLSFLALLLVAVTGCHSYPQVDVFGVKYDGLFPEEEEQMVAIARGFLRGMRKNLLPGEAKIVCTTAPEMRINYEGDRCGQCVLTWPCATRQVKVQLVGSFLTPEMIMQMYTVKNSDYIVDYSSRRHRIKKTVPPPEKSRLGGAGSSTRRF